MSNHGRPPTTRNRPRRRHQSPGSYTAPISSGHFYGFSFFVAPGGTSLLNVAVTDIVACTPAGSFPDVDQLVIPQVTVQPNGSFSGTGTQQGVFEDPRPSSRTLLPGTSRERPRPGL